MHVSGQRVRFLIVKAAAEAVSERCCDLAEAPAQTLTISFQTKSSSGSMDSEDLPIRIQPQSSGAWSLESCVDREGQTEAPTPSRSKEQASVPCARWLTGAEGPPRKLHRISLGLLQLC